MSPTFRCARCDIPVDPETEPTAVVLRYIYDKAVLFHRACWNAVERVGITRVDGRDLDLDWPGEDL